MPNEVAGKLARVRALLDDERDAVVLRSPGMVAWLSGGGRTHVVATPETGVAALVVTADDVTVVTTVNEAPRLAAEELGALAAQWQVLAWSADLTEALPEGPRVGADVPYGQACDLDPELEQARRSLLPQEVERYGALGRDAAEACTDVCATLTASMTEYDVAGRLSAALLSRGIDPVVLLVAGGDRLPQHRHPLPTAGPVGDLVMVVACGRRHGLIASLTRFVATRTLAARLAGDYERLLRVDAAYNGATRPGATVGACCAAGIAAYAVEGFAADEWSRHHQGGPTGYATRDYLATPDSAAVIVDSQAFAWNPSVPSLKVEDTVLATASGTRVLTTDLRWPATSVDGLVRPGILIPG